VSSKGSRIPSEYLALGRVCCAGIPSDWDEHQGTRSEGAVPWHAYTKVELAVRILNN
jgi:hypothetical protein